MSCILFFDGACRGNPGPMAIGVVLMEDGKNVEEVSRRIGMGTNNIAEWRALVEGLKLAKMHGCRVLEVRGDSQLIIKQITGQYKVRSENLIPLFDKARKLCDSFADLRFKWVAREENRYTDALSNKALNIELKLNKLY